MVKKLSNREKSPTSGCVCVHPRDPPTGNVISARKYVLRMRNRYILYYYYTSSTVVPLRMTDRATENDVTPKGFPRVRACAIWSWKKNLKKYGEKTL
jgi:hypothetical protein